MRQLQLFTCALYLLVLSVVMHINCADQILPDKAITKEVAHGIFMQHAELHEDTHAGQTQKLRELLSIRESSARKKSWSVTVALVQAGVDPNTQGGYATLLGDTIGWNNLPLTEYFLKKGALPQKGLWGTPAYFRVKSQEMFVLLKNYGTDFTEEPDADFNILHEKASDAARGKCTIDFLSFLLYMKVCCINYMGSFNLTPLIAIAVDRPQINAGQIARLLLYHGAERHHRSRLSDESYDCTAAQIAANYAMSASITPAKRQESVEFAAVLNSHYASTLAKMAMRTLLISEEQAGLDLLLLPQEMPGAFATVLEQLSARIKNDRERDQADECTLQAKADVAFLKMLQQSCSMNQELIAEYYEERREPVQNGIMHL